MTDEERITHLMTVPPRSALTRRELFERMVMRVCGIISVVALGIAGAAIVVDASASCVNNALSTRNGPAARDAAAHVTYATAQSAYDMLDKAWHATLSATLAAPKAQQRELYKAFRSVDIQLNSAAVKREAANAAYKAQLSVDQADRAAHPLGKC